MPHKRDEEENQEQIKQDLCDAGGSYRDPRKTQQCGDQRDDKKSECPAQHVPSCSFLPLDGSAQCQNRAVEWTRTWARDSVPTVTDLRNALHTARTLAVGRPSCSRAFPESNDSSRTEGMP